MLPLSSAAQSINNRSTTPNSIIPYPTENATPACFSSSMMTASHVAPTLSASVDLDADAFDFDTALLDGTSSESSLTSSPPPQSPETVYKVSAPLETARRRGKATASNAKPRATTQKRARRSEIERQSRLRRLDELNRRREELVRLEWEYNRLAAREGLEELICETDTAASVAIVAAKPVQEKHRIHRRIAFMVKLLNEEQNQFRKLLQEHEVFEATIRDAWRCDLTEDTAMRRASSIYNKPSFERREWIHPAQCFGFLRDTYELISQFDQSHDFISTGAMIMGWTDKRRIDDATGHLHYGFRKKMLGQHAETLLTKSWDVFGDAEQMWKLLVDPSVTTEFYTLQVVNDDLLIIRRDHKHPHAPMTFLTVHVLFRLQTPQGYLLCFRTIPVPDIQTTLEPHEIWFDILNWTMFNHMYDDAGNVVGCEVVCGGSLADPSQVTTKHWLFELIISVLKWESLCVAPLFIMS